MPPARTIAAPSVTSAIERAIEDGVAPGPLWAAAGLDPLRSYTAEDRVGADALFETWATIMRSVRDPGWPIRYARTLSVDSYDALGLACKTAPNVREALRRVCRYQRLWTDTSRWVLVEDCGPPRLEFRREEPRTLGVCCANEAAVAEMVQSIRGAAGEDFAPVGVRFRHAAPGELQAHRDFFRAPIVFDAEVDGIAFAPAFFDHPVPQADAALSAFFERFLEDKLEDASTERPLQHETETLLAGTLSSGPPKAADVARRLGMSERTLSRRLAERGTSFGAVVDGARRRIAERLLQHGQHRVGEVAFLLGFSETSSFSRAFKRWTGLSPVEYRERS